MKIIVTSIQELYKVLKRDTIFNIALVTIIVINIFFFQLVVRADLLISVLTLLSIFFGFMISAICNLFGRNITYELAKKSSVFDSGISQLQEIKGDFSQLLGCCFFLMGVSFIALIIKGDNRFVYLLSCDPLKYGISAVYLFCLFFILIAMFNYVVVLLNLLINETKL